MRAPADGDLKVTVRRHGSSGVSGGDRIPHGASAEGGSLLASATGSGCVEPWRHLSQPGWSAAAQQVSQSGLLARKSWRKRGSHGQCRKGR